MREQNHTNLVLLLKDRQAKSLLAGHQVADDELKLADLLLEVFGVNSPYFSANSISWVIDFDGKLFWPAG